MNILLHPCGDFCRIDRALRAKEGHEKLSSLESFVLESGRERIATTKGDFPLTFDLVAEDISRRIRICRDHHLKLFESNKRLWNMASKIGSL